mmetsp:Transcript_8481/g.26406  ORF Transcript_8481/g.26406 Transcript_8481/m.26406 type:complete len:239 (+) Transcript_8481:177-893(+)
MDDAVRALDLGQGRRSTPDNELEFALLCVQLLLQCPSVALHIAHGEDTVADAEPVRRLDAPIVFLGNALREALDNQCLPLYILLELQAQGLGGSPPVENDGGEQSPLDLALDLRLVLELRNHLLGAAGDTVYGHDGVALLQLQLWRGARVEVREGPIPQSHHVERGVVPGIEVQTEGDITGRFLRGNIDLGGFSWRQGFACNFHLQPNEGLADVGILQLQLAVETIRGVVFVLQGGLA